MVSEFPEDNLAILSSEYRKKFGDSPPWHVNHGLDPEDALRKAIETNTAIPEVGEDNTATDNF